MFYYSQSPKAKVLAEAIQSSIKKVADRKNTRSPKANDSYYMLKRTGSPTVIVECGFLSNPDEAEMLQTKAYQTKLVEAIYQGICIYEQTKEQTNEK